MLSRVALETIAWLLTFVLHSTALLLVALLLARLVRHDATRAVLWKTALFGALGTTLIQMLAGFDPVAGRLLVAERITVPPVAQHDTPLTDRHVAVTSPARSASVSHEDRDKHTIVSNSVTARPSALGVPLEQDGAALVVSSSDASSVGRALRTTVPGAARWSTAILIAWLCMAGLLLLRLARRFRRLNVLLSDRKPVTDACVIAQLDQLVRAARLRRSPSLTMSDNCVSPIVLRVNEICVPARFLGELDHEQREVALAHEVAHIARRDAGWSLVAAILNAIFFFHPLYAIARSRLRAASEVLADDWAVQQTGSRIALARCLIRVAEWIDADGPFSTPAIAMADSDSPLFVRVERLLGEPKRQRAPSRRSAVLVAALMLFLVAWTAPRVACDCSTVSLQSFMGSAPSPAPGPAKESRSDSVFESSRIANTSAPVTSPSQDPLEENRNMNSNIVPCAALVAAAILTGCSDAPQGSSSIGARDSSGVAIIENRGNPWATEPLWRLSVEPVLRIGTATGDSMMLFDEIEGIAILTDGRIVVSNQGTSSIRWFDAQGRFLFERGRAGAGPGEFSSLQDVMRIAADSIVAVDGSGRRMTLFSKDGSLGPTIRVVGLPASASSVHRLSAGSWIVATSGMSSRQLGPERKPGIFRLDSPILKISPDGSVIDTLGIFPQHEIEIKESSWGPAYYGKRTTSAVFGDQIFVGTGERLEVDVYTPDGKRVRSIRAPDVNLFMTPERDAEFRNFMRSRNANDPPDRKAEAERRVLAMNLPTMIPGYKLIMTDDSGNLWLAEYRFDLTSPRRFLVFGPDGRFISVVAVPERFTPLTITRDHIWGRATDSLDVEYVVGYAIARGK